MQYRKLGSSEFEVSRIAFGAWQLTDAKYWGDFDPQDAAHAVQDAIDAGVNLFDTAEIYDDGRSEVALGKALGQRRAEVLIATKVGPDHCGPETVRASCEGSLQRLGTDWIDVYQIHWPPRDVPFADVWGALLELRGEGKIRAVGLSNFGVRDLASWPDLHEVASNQIGYNLLFRAPEFGIIPACHEHELGVLVYMPLMQGLLCGKWAQVADVPSSRRRTRHFNAAGGLARHGGPGCERLTFETIGELKELAAELKITMADLAIARLLAKTEVTSLIVGCRRPDQLRRNVKVVGMTLDAGTCARVDAATDSLKQELGPNADMWDNDENARIH